MVGRWSWMAVAGIVGALAAPAAAGAEDLYVSAAGGGGCAQAAPCGLDDAIARADATPDTRDRIVVVGSLVRTTPVDLGNSPIELIGSGRGYDCADDIGTRIRVSGAPAVRLFSGPAGASGIEGMCLRSDVQDVLGRTGVTIRHVSADGYGPAADIEIRPGGQGETVLEDVRVGGGVNGDPARAGIAVFGDPGDVTRIEDGGVVSTTGISVQGGTVVVRRTWIYAEASGIEVRSGSVYASSLPITAYADARAVAVTGSAGPAAADLRQVTVTGTNRGGDSTGVLVGGGPHPARADILATDLLASPAVATAVRVQPGGQAAVAYSNFHATTGPVEDRGGNIDSPGVPIHRTALIDHGGTTPLGAAESQTDRLGRPRITDGDADGVPARDIGDREFQPAHLVLTGSAPVAQVGQRVTFDASASTFGDIPGYNPYQGIRNFGAYYWDLDGDGSFETLTNAPTATFVYSTTGVRTVRLRGNGSFFGHYDGPAPQVAYTQVVIDTIAPTLSASVTPAPLPRFRLRVSEPARVQWKLQRRTRGRWKSAGTFTRRVRRGTSRVPLPARVQRAKVKSGSYRATLVATDRAGNRSRVRPLGFVVAR